MKRTFLAILLSATLGVVSQGVATEYFVDSHAGDDSASGTSPESAWETLDRVNQADFEPGDVIRFRRDGIWRGKLRCKSGAEGNPIVYTDYRTGKEYYPPRILNSVDLTGGAKWTRIGDENSNLWATREGSWRDLGATSDYVRGFASGRWHVYTEEDAKASCREETFADLDGAEGYRIECAEPGSEATYLQWTTQGFQVKDGGYVALRFKARASAPVTIDSGVSLMMTGKPWSSYGETLELPGEISTEWGEYTVVFRPAKDASDGRITFFLGGKLPQGGTFDFVPLETHEYEDISLGLHSDVGNLVLTEPSPMGPSRGIMALFEYRPKKFFASTSDRMEYAGFKRWSRDELKEYLDFWYDNKERRVYMVSAENPGKLFVSIEAPLRDHCCVCPGHDVIIENITFSHTGAHGVSLPNPKRITIRNCSFDWIGGGDLYGQGGEGRRVRFGNGVEFWEGGQDCVVEKCRFSRIYDVALTAQGPEKDVAKNLIMRDNLIYRCEQAFEIWFTHPETVVEGVVFEHNLCVDTGRDWSHYQRPNKIATPILGYGLDAKTVDITIRKNVFYDTQQFFIKCWHNRIADYHIDDNVYWVDETKPHESGDKYFCYDAANGKEPMTFDEFRAATGHDKNSRWIKPEFKDYGNDVFTLKNQEELDAGPRVEHWGRLW
ncbi:MAG: right-handed parallel beta-helix repeat-containing protein [Thermoguttaceae bacterium]|nr:right-handed parallel beta-helix repeat-containing protein [Thermoguttaceae bacterium]